MPILLKGIKTPVQTRFEPLLETGRTSSSAPNIQNIKRLVGMRECFRPRPGYESSSTRITRCSNSARGRRRVSGR